MSNPHTRRARPATRVQKAEATLFPIVGIGASAGGLEAVTALLKHLPVHTGFAFVFVQHLDPQHESVLTHLLARATPLPVIEITNNLRVKPNRVYVIPPNATLRIDGGVLKLQLRPQGPTPPHPIDLFFESLAQDRRDRAIGVILSGTATDGTLGLEAIKGEGGITFAQDSSARYDSMPRSAEASGSVDFVLSPENIARELARIARHPDVAGGHKVLPDVSKEEGTAAAAHEGAETPLQSAGKQVGRFGTVRGEPQDSARRTILVLLRNRLGVDFSLYKPMTIQRRIARRMVVNKAKTLEEYAVLLENNPTEIQALYSDLLISVTGFFRNPRAFDVLKRKVFPKLLGQRGNDPIRVWVPGCSTGQEAYSIAMVFAEVAAEVSSARRLQIFATDLNEVLLDKARHGLYLRAIKQDVTSERLRRFFVEEEDGYRVSKSLREMVVFARQNLISDPPFSRMDLISCRNLMIYLEPNLQRKLIPTFHHALKPGGVLFIGASESIGRFTDLFEPTDKTHRIYSKKASTARDFFLPVMEKPAEPPSRDRTLSVAPRARPLKQDVTSGIRGELEAQHEADRVAVNRFAPPGVLINADLQVLQFRGATGDYLQPPKGKASFDVLKMAREGLMLPLRSAINKAKKEDKVVRKENIRLRRGHKARSVTVEVIPLKNLKQRCFLVAFRETPDARRAASGPPQSSALRPGSRTLREEARYVADLEAELAEMHEYLQSIKEEHEAADEELQASNEEVQSANEELQSINEELETSTEELESANEELTTVNEEMASRNAELSRLNSDLLNIQTSANLSIVLLGRDLTIRRFSVHAEKQFNLMAADVGRSFSQVRHNLVLHSRQESSLDLESLIADAITSVRERQLEVQDQEGRWFSLRVRPYMTLDNKVDGAVLVLLDINDLKRTEQAVVGARDYAEAIIRTVRDALVILNADLRVHAANDAFYRMFHVQAEDCVGRLIFELGNHQWDIPKLRELLEHILPHESFFNDFEVTYDFEGGGRRSLLLNARRLRVDGGPSRILLGIQDVTDAHNFQTAAVEEAQKFKLLFDRSPLPKWLLDPRTLRFLNVNDAAVEHYGYSHEEFLHMTALDVHTSESLETIRETLLSSHRLPEKTVTQHRNRKGEIMDVEVRVNEITVSGAPAWLAVITDITELKRAERELKSLNDQLASELAATEQLQQTSTRLIRQDEPDALYQQSLKAAISIMHSDMASIQMVDEEQDALRLLAYQGFGPGFRESFDLVRPERKTVCASARKKGQRVVVTDVENDDSLGGTPALEDLRNAGIRAVQSTPLTSRGGRIIGVISTHWCVPHQPAEADLRRLDILARQTADLIERQKTEESLREADRRKNEFLAVLAHELRAPLAPIRNALEIIRLKETDTKAVRESAAMMARQVSQMARLVEDLFDVSRISRGKIELRRVRVELSSIVSPAVEAARPLLESKGLLLTVTLPPEPIFVDADPVRLSQAIVNLLNNAGKFTETGGRIWLTAEVEAAETDRLVIRVRDTGIGIGADQLNRIFDMFVQVDSSLERKHGGLGIGLALTKSLVELHGGTLEVHSAGSDQGSEFVMRLPILSQTSSTTTEIARDKSAAGSKPRRVLIVDDSPDAAESMSTLLELMGNETHTVYDGQQALEAAEKFRPDVILLDIGMPRLNGYDVARRIRQQPWSKQTVLVALTGWGQDEDRENSRKAGFNVHLVKPVNIAALTEVLNGVQ